MSHRRIRRIFRSRTLRNAGARAPQRGLGIEHATDEPTFVVVAEYVRHALTAETDVSAVPLVSAVFERSEVDEKHMRLSRRRWKSVGFVVLPEFLADALDRHQGFTLRGLERVVGVRVEMPRHHRGLVIERL